MKLYERFGIYAAWVVALISTLGSLYLSEIQAVPVCNACWYQRICMYSLVVILGIAAYYNDHKVTRYALPISTVGLLIAAYHVAIQKWPSLYVVNLCGNGPSCTDVDFTLFGWLTIPLMSLFSFLAIVFVLTQVGRPLTSSANKVKVLATLLLAIAISTAFVLMHRNPTVAINSEGYPFLGNKEARVQVVAIESLECPHCKHFEEEDFASLNKNYIVPGKIKYTLILVPVHGPKVLSGQTAYCILNQNGADAYFKFIELAFATQPSSDEAWSLTGLVDLAKQIPGVDSVALHRCLDDGDTQQLYWKRSDEAWKLAGAGVPAFFVNGRKTPVEDLFKTIDAELAQ